MSHSEHPSAELRRLLSCKRYEQPPPGYFLSFSDKVIARIQAGEAAEYSSWWSWLVDRFDARPALVCAYGMAVSSLLLAGIHLSHAFEAETAMMAAPSGAWFASTPGSSLMLAREGGQIGFTASSFPASKWVVGDEPSPEVLPHDSVRFLPAGLKFGGR